MSFDFGDVFMFTIFHYFVDQDHDDWQDAALEDVVSILDCMFPGCDDFYDWDVQLRGLLEFLHVVSFDQTFDCRGPLDDWWQGVLTEAEDEGLDAGLAAAA